MKNLFSVNVKTAEKTYTPFVVRTVSEETASRQESNDVQMSKSKKASELPLWLRIIQLLCLIVAVSIFGGLMQAFAKNEHDESFSEMWARFVGNGAITLIVIGAICLAAFIALLVWGRLRSKKVHDSPEYQSVIEEQENVQSSSYEELGVPSDADELDVFCFPFRYNRKGKELWGNGFSQYAAIRVKVFKDDDGLYFADTSDVIKIPLSNIKGVNVINKRLGFMGWNKEQKPTSPEYRPYKITVNNVGVLFVKWCFSVNLNLNGEEYEIIIPPYESEVLKKYVDLDQAKVEQKEESVEQGTEQEIDKTLDDEKTDKNLEE